MVERRIALSLNDVNELRKQAYENDGIILGYRTKEMRRNTFSRWDSNDIRDFRHGDIIKCKEPFKIGAYKMIKDDNGKVTQLLAFDYLSRIGITTPWTYPLNREENIHFLEWSSQCQKDFIENYKVSEPAYWDVGELKTRERHARYLPDQAIALQLQVVNIKETQREVPEDYSGVNLSYYNGSLFTSETTGQQVYITGSNLDTANICYESMMFHDFQILELKLVTDKLEDYSNDIYYDTPKEIIKALND